MKPSVLFVHKVKGIFTLLFLLNILTISCAENKFNECQKIIEITMKIGSESKSNFQTKDIQKVLKVADAFEDGSKEMQAIQIKDKQLLEYKTGFAEVYRGNAKATRDFVAALQQKDVSGAKLTKRNLQEIGRKEKKLVNDMNNYCLEKNLEI